MKHGGSVIQETNNSHIYFLVGKITNHSHPYGQGYFSQALMDIKDTLGWFRPWVRWPLSSQLSHCCRGLQRWRQTWPDLGSSFSTSKWIFSSAVSVLWQAAIWPKSCKEYRCCFSLQALPLLQYVSLSLPMYVYLFLFFCGLIYLYTDRWCMYSHKVKVPQQENRPL